MNDDKVRDVGQLPEEPLKMPPPYWRSSGAIFHVQESLEALQGLLERLAQVHSVTESRLAEYVRKHPHDTSEDNSEFCDICDELCEVEHRIKLKSEVAVLMSAIEAEDQINMFCVYNLPRDVSEQIEKLSATEKLLVASVLSAEHSVKDWMFSRQSRNCQHGEMLSLMDTAWTGRQRVCAITT